MPVKQIKRLGIRSLSIAENARRGSPVYTEAQERLGRPLSPHVTIYSFPFTAMTSITNRLTGIALSTGMGAISGYAAVYGAGPELQQSIMDFQHSVPYLPHVSRFCAAFPITYHYLASVRQLIWDSNPDLINLEAAPQMSGILFGSSMLLSLAASIYTLNDPPLSPEELEMEVVMLTVDLPPAE